MENSDSSNNTKNLDGQSQTVTKFPARTRNSTASGQAAGQARPVKPSDPRKRRIRLIALAILLFAGGILAYIWWRYSCTHESTNDAYVTGRQFQLNSRVNDTVVAVLVNDNQVVHAGQLLVQLDPRDFQTQVRQAQANLEASLRQARAAQANIGVPSYQALGQTTQARGNVSAAISSVAGAEAAVIAAQANATSAKAQLFQADADLKRATADYQRYSFLTQQGVTPPQQLDAYRNTYEEDLAKQKSALESVRQTKAQLAQAQKQVAVAEGQLVNSKGGLQSAQGTAQQTKVNQSQYEASMATATQSEATLKYNQLQLSYTNIYSPTDGRVGNAETIVVGQRVQPGQALIAIQQPNPWIVANFKETQLEWMRPGQRVGIRIDAFPHERFWGWVDSIAPASGSTTALLPPDNATGNFTKIVQRVPVKIVFDPHSIRGYESLIVPGMSTEVTVLRP